MLPAAAPINAMASRSTTTLSDEPEDSRSSSSTASPVPADNEESDFFLGANDSESSLGVPNFQDMQVDDTCWPPINRLPNEILISIFAKLGGPSDLYHSMLVCKRWARNAVDLLWHRPACTNWRNHSSICQTLGLESPFFSYRDFIKRLNLAALADKVNDGSVLPLAACTRVERLTLTNCRGLTDSGLIALVENSPSLLALDISSDKNITESSINAISENCKRLQGLNISGCDNISNESMVNLAENCRYIKRVSLLGNQTPSWYAKSLPAQTQRMSPASRQCHSCICREVSQYPRNRFVPVRTNRQCAGHCSSIKRQLSPRAPTCKLRAYQRRRFPQPP